MPVVTITSDFGSGDYYLARIKGALLCRDAGLTLVDINHQVANYDIVQAAFIFRHAWPSFPPGAIHLLSVMNFPHSEARFLAIRHREHFFIGPDNGIFSLVFDPFPAQAFLLPQPRSNCFPLEDIFADAVQHILLGKDFAAIGAPAAEMERRITLQPVISRQSIRGSVVHIDNYENAITNISRELFERVGQNRPFALYFKRHDPITRLSAFYHDVPVGEPLCWFNSAGLIEIAINMGKAGSLLGLKIEDTVQIDFLAE
jgi:S-adenosylmethionine hydrolase